MLGELLGGVTGTELVNEAEGGEIEIDGAVWLQLGSSTFDWPVSTL